MFVIWFRLVYLNVNRFSQWFVAIKIYNKYETVILFVIVLQSVTTQVIGELKFHITVPTCFGIYSFIFRGMYL
jgi:hypothetical protein